MLDYQLVLASIHLTFFPTVCPLGSMSEEGNSKSAAVAESDDVTKSVQPHAAFGAYNQTEHGGRERFSSRIAFYFTGELVDVTSSLLFFVFFFSTMNDMLYF